MVILDTDHLSLLQRRDAAVSARVLLTPAVELATTVITVEEQLRGRLVRRPLLQTDPPTSAFRTYTPTPASPPFDRSSSPTMFPSGSLIVTSRPTGTSYGSSLNL
jgi:hypothetical protein